MDHYFYKDFIEFFFMSWSLRSSTNYVIHHVSDLLDAGGLGPVVSDDIDKDL